MINFSRYFASSTKPHQGSSQEISNEFSSRDLDIFKDSKIGIVILWREKILRRKFLSHIHEGESTILHHHYMYT